jgi:hypothetical protein
MQLATANVKISMLLFLVRLALVLLILHLVVVIAFVVITRTCLLPVPAYALMITLPFLVATVFVQTQMLRFKPVETERDTVVAKTRMVTPLYMKLMDSVIV